MIWTSLYRKLLIAGTHDPRTAIRRKDVLSMLQAMNNSEDPQKWIPNDHIPTYMIEMLAAGSSMTSHTAAFACHQLACHHYVLKALQKELIKIILDKEQINKWQVLSLKLLEGIIYKMMPLPYDSMSTGATPQWMDWSRWNEGRPGGYCFDCRSCPGSNLALTKLKYIIGTLFRRFTVRLPEAYSNKPMNLVDVFTAGFTAGLFWLHFEEMKAWLRECI